MSNHGIFFSNNTKHHEIIDFNSVFKVRSSNRQAFQANYSFIWDIFNEVAMKNNIKLPRTWVCMETLTQRNRYNKTRSNAFIMEPLGPITHVDARYSINQYIYASEQQGTVMYSFNWREVAEHFFMLRGSAAQALQNASRVRTGLMCEKWRAVKLPKKTG